jgi:hypothetical protein
MDSQLSCYDPLAHFDVDSRATSRRLPTRGVAWVLRWAAALAVVTYSAVVLAEFAYCLAAEHAMARAARAGAVEATLPRATRHSVTATIKRRLVSSPGLFAQMRLVVEQNGALLSGQIHPRPGDRLSVTLTAPAGAALPAWFRPLSLWTESAPLRVSAAREMPDRMLAANKSSYRRGI